MFISKKVITNELKQSIIDYYLSKPMSLSEVGNHFNLSNPTICNILKCYPKYPKARIYNPQLDESYFSSIDTEAKAYFLGLIISDGNVFKQTDSNNRQSSISITLDLEDEYMLNAFKDEVKTNTQIGHDGRGCGTIAVRSDRMANDLAKYGIVPRKSFITFLPQNIEPRFMSHLIRGILDGDGNVQSKLNPLTNKHMHGFNFCGSYHLMSDIADYLYFELPILQRPKVYSYKGKSLSETKIRNIHDMIVFGEWLYNNANLYLIRKHNVYLDFKKYCVTNGYDNPELTN